MKILLIVLAVIVVGNLLGGFLGWAADRLYDRRDDDDE